MKPAERRLLLAIYRECGGRPYEHPSESGRYVRDICNEVGVFKQNCYYLDKWAGKGWYEYGVTLDLGWLTPEGVKAAAKVAAAEGVKSGDEHTSTD